MVLNEGFKEMTANETFNYEGGGWPLVVGLIGGALIIACTAKGCADADAGK